MALLRYLQSRDGLPDPRGPLSSTISAQAIAEVNREVQEATSIGSKRTERGPYKRYSASVRAEQVCQSPQCGCSSSIFSKKLNCRVSETTVRSIRSSYAEEFENGGPKTKGTLLLFP